MECCPTIAIQTELSEGNPTGIVMINKSDYDANPSAYTLVTPDEVKAEEVKMDDQKSTGRSGKHGKKDTESDG